MKAWQLHRLGGELRFDDVRTPEPRPGSALVRIEASALMSYIKGGRGRRRQSRMHRDAAVIARSLRPAAATP